MKGLILFNKVQSDNVNSLYVKFETNARNKTRYVMSSSIFNVMRASFSKQIIYQLICCFTSGHYTAKQDLIRIARVYFVQLLIIN